MFFDGFKAYQGKYDQCFLWNYKDRTYLSLFDFQRAQRYITFCLFLEKA